MYCKKCGNYVEKGESFCTKCGAAMQAHPSDEYRSQEAEKTAQSYRERAAARSEAEKRTRPMYNNYQPRSNSSSAVYHGISIKSIDARNAGFWRNLIVTMAYVQLGLTTTAGLVLGAILGASINDGLGILFAILFGAVGFFIGCVAVAWQMLFINVVDNVAITAQNTAENNRKQS